MHKSVYYSLFIIIAITTSCDHCSAQKVENLPGRMPGSEWESTFVEKIADDSLCTTFHLWLKGGVKHHFHTSHTECLYFLEGEGQMELGESIFNVKAGDFVQVPRGVVHSVNVTKPIHVISIQTPQWLTEDRQFVAPIRRPHNE